MKQLPEKCLDDYDVICFTETFARAPAGITGFYGFHSFAVSDTGLGRPKGGISCFLKAHLTPAEVMHDNKNCIVINAENLNIVGVYYPPQTDAENIIEGLAEANECLNRDKPTVIMGDFNCRIDQEAHSEKTTHLLTTLCEMGFSVANDPKIVTYICHNGASTIDLFFVEQNRLASNSRCTYSDITTGQLCRKHQAMELRVSWSQRSNTLLRPKPLSRMVDVNILSNSILLSEAYLALERNQAEKAYMLLCAAIAAASAYKPINRTAKPWFDAECHAWKHFTLQLLEAARINDALRPYYSAVRKSCKNVFLCKRTRYEESREKKMIDEAERQPYKFNVRGKQGAQCPIPMNMWKRHLKQLYNNPSVHIPREPFQVAVLRQSVELEKLNRPFEEAEVLRCIQDTKNGKAAGRDLIFYEHIKSTIPILMNFWLRLFNFILNHGQIVTTWHMSITKVLFKGKGDINDPNSYRGIALNSTVYKILTKLVSVRLRDFGKDSIPQQQFGFMEGRSVHDATSYLLDDVRNSIYSAKRKFVFAVFVDYTKAFDSVPRWVILEKLASIGVAGQMARLLVSILQNNIIQVDDGIQLSEEIHQNMGLLQGDALSPLLFILLTAELPGLIIERHPHTRLCMYADDIVIWGESLKDVQAAMQSIVQWSCAHGLQVNTSKTKAMKFRKGGGLARKDLLKIDEEPIEFVNTFPYLGTYVHFSATSFKAHIKERARKALLAMATLGPVHKLSICAALKLFNIKIGPIASYAVKLIWNFMSVKDFQLLENVKSRYLKRCLCIDKTTKSRYAYLMCNDELFVKHVAQSFALPATPAYREFCDNHEAKKCDIHHGFTSTVAMTLTWWRQPNQEKRHIVTRYAVHGFHYKLCENLQYHEAGQLSCKCRLCGTVGISVYHAQDCEAGPRLSDLAT